MGCFILICMILNFFCSNTVIGGAATRLSTAWSLGVLRIEFFFNMIFEIFANARYTQGFSLSFAWFSFFSRGSANGGAAARSPSMWSPKMVLLIFFLKVSLEINVKSSYTQVVSTIFA